VRYLCQKTLIPSTPNQVLRLKEELLQGDFADNLQLLQVKGGRGAGCYSLLQPAGILTLPSFDVSLCVQAYPRDLDVEELIYQAKRLEGTTGAMD
jgi:hypothetical protein